MNRCCAVLNFGLPGFGTMVSACYKKDLSIFCLGMIQFLLIWVVIGIIWSWYHACLQWGRDNSKAVMPAKAQNEEYKKIQAESKDHAIQSQILIANASIGKEKHESAYTSSQ
jgi:hypothetical protein